MAQDFAKQRGNHDNGKRRRAVSKAPPPGNANWSWFFSGLMTGVIVSIAAYLAVLKLEEGVVEDAQAVQAGSNPEDQPTYSFYQVLTQAEVAVGVSDAAPQAEQAADPAAAAAVNAAAPATATPTPAPPQQLAVAAEENPDLYLLQAGSFQNQADAESRRARILLLNMNASIAEGIVVGRTHYRVQVGPFAGRQNAETARNLLSGNDIESIVLRVAQ